MKSKPAAGCGSISTVISSIVLECVSSIIIIIMIIIIIIIMIIIIIIVIIIIITMIKCRGRYRKSTITNTELLVTLHNGRRPLSNIKRSSPSDAGRTLYMPLKWLIHHLT